MSKVLPSEGFDSIESEVLFLREKVKINFSSIQLNLYNSEIIQRNKIDYMSAEVTDENPYSRLMALKRMGIVKV